MRNQYKEMFDGFAPVRGDDELLKAVLDRKAENKMAAKFSKKIFIPVIAAAVLGATAVGASAAYQWSQAQAVQNVIDKNGMNNVDYPKFDLNKLGGKTLNDVIECNGYDIKTVGVAADEHTAYLFYDIVFDENFDYSLKENEEWGCNMHVLPNLDWVKEYWGTMGDRHTDEPDPAWTDSNGFLGMEGNVAHCYNTCTMTGLTVGGKTLEYECHFGLSRSNKNDREQYELVDESCDGKGVKVAIDFDNTGNSRIVKPDSKTVLPDSKTGTVKHLELTPFSLFARVDWDYTVENSSIHDTEYNNNGKFTQYSYESDELLTALRVKFKDGTVKDITAFVLDKSGSRISPVNDVYFTSLAICWGSPVDIDQIASVTIGDVEVEL